MLHTIPHPGEQPIDSSPDVEVLHAALTWLNAGDPVFLVTVAGTWGSSPRQPGALMAIHPDGRFCGSVSGGCVEDDLVQRVMRGEFDTGLPKIEEYGVRPEQSQRVGLPCGGRLTLVIEQIDTPVQLQTVADTLRARQQISRRVCLTTGETSLHPVQPASEFSFDGDTLEKVFGPSWRLLLIGAGELTRRVAQLGLSLDYAVTICDSRPEYAEGWQVEGTAFINHPPAETVDILKPDPRTAVLALSHTPALDDAGLAAALGSDAYYVGALGSQQNQRARCKRLEKRGVTPQQLARLHGPVGLAIGSRTPAEIAVAIMAALIQERGQQHNRLSQSLNTANA